MRKAWEKVAEREGLSKDALEKATRGFFGFVLGRNYDLAIDTSKARKLGRTGWVQIFFFHVRWVGNEDVTLCRYVDTWDALSGVFD